MTQMKGLQNMHQPQVLFKSSMYAHPPFPLSLKCTQEALHCAPCPHLQVYAIDLLGFGRSSKPQMKYSMELWRDLLVDFMQVCHAMPCEAAHNTACSGHGS